MQTLVSITNRAKYLTTCRLKKDMADHKVDAEGDSKIYLVEINLFVTTLIQLPVFAPAGNKKSRIYRPSRNDMSK